MPAGSLASSLLIERPGERHVLRALVVSIVLAFTLGSNASLLCRIWCQTPAAAASGCHDGALSNSPIVTMDGSCGVRLGVAAVQEEVRRGVSAPETAFVILILADPFGETHDAARLRHAAWVSAPSRPRLPLSILRI